jgi:hypothetical protein
MRGPSSPYTVSKEFWMSDGADATAEGVGAERTAKGLAYVCAHLDEISAALPDDAAGKDGSVALERLRSAMRGDGNLTGRLDDIHHALPRAGDALGVYGHSRSVIQPLPGIDTDRPLEIVYRCPADLCLRADPGPAITPPRCGFTGEMLRRERL